MIYIVLNIYKNSLKLKEIEGGTSNENNGDDDIIPLHDDINKNNSNTTTLTTAEKKLEKDSLRRSLLKDFLWVIPVVTWSLPNWATDPLVDKKTVNAFCFAESLVTLRELAL